MNAASRRGVWLAVFLGWLTAAWAGYLQGGPDQRASVSYLAAYAMIKAYASGWRDFLAFCAERDLSALPASEQTVALYLSTMAGRGAKATTIARRMVVISQARQLLGRVRCGGRSARPGWRRCWQPVRRLPARRGNYRRGRGSRLVTRSATC